MGSGAVLADFDSASGFVRALAAVLHDRPFRHLGRSALSGGLARAGNRLPQPWVSTALGVAGQLEAIRPAQLRRVSAEAFAEWMTDRYPRRPAQAVVVGSSNGAIMHLAAALGVPWLPQTFLVPVRRRADPIDPAADLRLATGEIRALLDREPALQLHQMHDPNQDRAMLGWMAYLRFKLRALPPAYRQFLRDVLAPGGTIIMVDCSLSWPVIRLGDRQLFQTGAVGGLQPADYLERWSYPPPDGEAPEAEWGLEPALVDDVLRFAELAGYRVVRLQFGHPDDAGPFVAEAYRAWHAAAGHTADRLLIETFISVEPFWALATRTVPLWTTFPVQDSLAAATKYVEAGRWREIVATLFAHGTDSAGLASVAEWQALVGRAEERGWLAGVDPDRWPRDPASLDRYAAALHADRHAALLPRRPMPLACAAEAAGASDLVEWSARR
ncbi:MAG TPA: hypothetical protein VG708_00710 [Mycobacteriales bacterium]|nr:hypothetical protein [Mycobacteriales bacterium]